MKKIFPLAQPANLLLVRWIISKVASILQTRMMMIFS